METKEVMALVAYKPGVVIPQAGYESEKPPQIDVQVVMYERGRLLIRVEKGIESLAPGVPLALEVPTDRALIRFDATAERVSETTDRAYIVHLIVDEIVQVQRRKQDRYEVNFQCSFVPMREGETESDLRGRGRGLGRVINMSLGGLQFETTYVLPPGMLALFEVALPNGRLVFQGKVIQAADKINASRDVHTYGVKFARMDSVTSQKLNRLILMMERKKRRIRQVHLAARTRGPGDRDRVRRAIAERWAGRNRRGRDR